jgi:DNA-binding HxlR family transcriptional regulator/DNA-binding XRE family transcriptional regulator
MKKSEHVDKTKKSRINFKTAEEAGIDALDYGKKKFTLRSDNYSTILGRVLTARRLELALTQRDLARMAQCTRKFVCEYERGKCGLSIVQFLVVAQALNISMFEATRKVERALADKKSMRKLEQSIGRTLAQNEEAAEAIKKNELERKVWEKRRKQLAKVRDKELKARALEREKLRKLAKIQRAMDAEANRAPRKSTRRVTDFDRELAEFPETTFAIKPSDASLVENAIQLLSGKWATAILIQVAQGPKRMGELILQLPGLTAKTASERLRELEKAGLVARKSFPEVPPRVEYTLTRKGQDAITLLERTKQTFKGVRS